MNEGYGAPPPKKGLPIWAWFIIVPCGCIVLAVPAIAILAAIMFPVLSQSRNKARSISCLSNEKQISLGLLMYSQDYDEKFPPAKSWIDKNQPYVKNDSLYHCPNASVFGYAFNKDLSGLPLAKISSPQTTIFIYDSSTLSKNATDSVTSLPSPPRHGRTNNVSYADGHAMSYPRFSTDQSGQ